MERALKRSVKGAPSGRGPGLCLAGGIFAAAFLFGCRAAPPESRGGEKGGAPGTRAEGPQPGPAEASLLERLREAESPLALAQVLREDCRTNGPQPLLGAARTLLEEDPGLAARALMLCPCLGAEVQDTLSPLTRARPEPPELEGFRAEAAEFAAQVFAGKVVAPPDPQGKLGLERRAIDILAAVLRKETLARPLPEIEGGERRVLEVLAPLLDGCGESALRTHMLRRLVERAGISFTCGVSDYYPEQWWERLYLGGVAGMVLASRFKANDAAELLAFLYCDRVETLDLLRGFETFSDTRAVLRGILEQGVPRLPFPLPRWKPTVEAAGRFLGGSDRDKLWAARHLALSGDPAAVPVLQRALEREADPEIALYLKACLGGLGEQRYRDEVLAAVEARWEHAVPAGLPEGPEELNRGLETIRDLWNPLTWNRASETAWAHPVDLLHFLARGGDAEACERLMALRDASAALDYAVRFEELIRPWPFLRGYWEAAPARLSFDARGRATALPPAGRDARGEDPIARDIFAGFRRAVGGALVWEAEARRFRIRETALAAWIGGLERADGLPARAAVEAIAGLGGRGPRYAEEAARALLAYLEGAPEYPEAERTPELSYFSPDYAYEEELLDGQVVFGKANEYVFISGDTESVRIPDRDGALHALLELARKAPEGTAHVLAEAAARLEGGLQLGVVAALGFCGSQARDAIPVLGRISSSAPSRATRKEALRAVQRIGREDGSGLDLLARVLLDRRRDAEVRAFAAWALGEYRARKSDAAAALRRAIQAPGVSRYIASHAAWALVRLGVAGEKLLEPLEGLLREPGNLACAIACRAAGDLGPGAGRLLAPLLRIVEGPPPGTATAAQCRIEAAATVLEIAGDPAAVESARRALLDYTRGVCGPLEISYPDGGALRALRVLERDRRRCGH